MKSPSPKCYMTFWDMVIYSDTLNWSNISPFFLTYHWTGPYYHFWPYYQISRGFHRTLQRVQLANIGRSLLRTSGPVPFWTCICSNVETILSWTCHIYGPSEFRTSLSTSILLQKHNWEIKHDNIVHSNGVLCGLQHTSFQINLSFILS